MNNANTAAAAGRPAWEPLRTLWLAQILVHDGTEPAAARLAYAAWCTDREAYAFTARRLPLTKIPAWVPRDSRLYGQVEPAVVESKFVRGHLVQEFVPLHTQARFAFVRAGDVVWSATRRDALS